MERNMAEEHPNPEQEPASAVATEERPAENAEQPAAGEQPAAAEQPPQGPVPPPTWGAAGQRPPRPIGPFGHFVRNRLTQIAAALLVGALIGGGTVAIIDNHNNGNTVQPGNQFGTGRFGNGYGQFPGGGGFGNGFGNGQQGNGFGDGSGSSSGGGSTQGGQGTGT